MLLQVMNSWVRSKVLLIYYGGKKIMLFENHLKFLIILNAWIYHNQVIEVNVFALGIDLLDWVSNIS